MAPQSPSTVTLNLALAVIASSVAPLLLLDRDLMVVAASTSFCKAFQFAPSKAQDCPLAELGDGEWLVPQLSSLLKATAAGFAEVEGYEMDLVRKGRHDRRLVLNAKKRTTPEAGTSGWCCRLPMSPTLAFQKNSMLAC